MQPVHVSGDISCWISYAECHSGLVLSFLCHHRNQVLNLGGPGFCHSPLPLPSGISSQNTSKNLNSLQTFKSLLNIVFKLVFIILKSFYITYSFTCFILLFSRIFEYPAALYKLLLLFYSMKMFYVGNFSA